MMTEISGLRFAGLRKRNSLRFFSRAGRLTRRVITATWSWLCQPIVVSFGGHELLRIPGWKIALRAIFFLLAWLNGEWVF
jgi:hypothetical protein